MVVGPTSEGRGEAAVPVQVNWCLVVSKVTKTGSGREARVFKLCERTRAHVSQNRSQSGQSLTFEPSGGPPWSEVLMRKPPEIRLRLTSASDRDAKAPFITRWFDTLKPVNALCRAPPSSSWSMWSPTPPHGPTSSSTFSSLSGTTSEMVARSPGKPGKTWSRPDSPSSS